MDQKTEEETPFCVAPFLSVAIWASGESVICCEDKGPPVGRLDFVDDISDLVNSERMCNARKQFMNGRLPAGCGWCLEQLKRQPTVYNFYQYHFKWEDIADCYDTAAGTVSQTQYFLIALSNLCTYSCRMCFERCSTRLSLDRHNMLGLPQPGYHQNNIDKIIRFIRSNLIRFVTFHGGNPINEPRFLDVLSELSSDTTVEILTNGSTLNSRGTDIRPHLERFKHVRFNISLDGTRKTTEYVRVHSDFDAVFRHFTEVKELPNASVNIHNTITNLNLFDLSAYYTMVLWGEFASADGISSYIATEPAIHRVSNLPDELRRRAKYQLEEFLRKLVDGAGPVAAEKITVTNAYVRNVIRRLDSAPYDPLVFAEFLISTKTTDEFYGFKPLPEYRYYLARSEPNHSEPAPQQRASL